MPTWLTPAAKRVWKAHIAILLANGALTPGNAAGFAQGCQAIADRNQLRRLITKEGWTIPDAKGSIKKHPAASAYSDACQRVRTFLQEFGMTPNPRARSHAEPQKVADPLGDFANEKDTGPAAEATGA